MANAMKEGLPPLPPGLYGCEIADNGYPVPWFVSRMPVDPEDPSKGVRPEFRVADAGKMGLAIRRRLCWVCGGKLNPPQLMIDERPPAEDLPEVAFVVGPMCTVNLVSAEPPCHPECAAYSAKACPFLTKPRMVRRDYDDVEGAQDPAGVMIRRNPGCCAVWHTRHYQATRAAMPGGGEGVLWSIAGISGKPTRLDWYAEGRPATRAEVERSFETGTCELEKLARDPKELAVLATAISRAKELWPAV